ncbi:MAG: phage tail protein, partial [Flavobacteriales bacterium]
MPTPITFTLTDAGLNAALDANANGLTISLTQIAIGSGKYTPLASITALQTELARYPLSGGDVEPNSKTLRFSAVIESAATRQAFEVGLFTSTGVLFAVASTTDTDPLILVTANIAFVAAFGMVVSEIPAGSLTVVTDPNAPLAIALIDQHLAAANPHPQYGMKAAFDSHVVQNTTEHTNLTNLISAEATARTNADTAHTAAANPHPQYGMKAAFDTHVVQKTTEHTNLTNLISAEATARANADTEH